MELTISLIQKLSDGEVLYYVHAEQFYLVFWVLAYKVMYIWDDMI